MSKRSWVKLGMLSGIAGIVSLIVAYAIFRVQFIKHVSTLESGGSLEESLQFLQAGGIAMAISACISILALFLITLSIIGCVRSKSPSEKSNAEAERKTI